MQFSKPRFVRKDIELGGVRLKKGDKIMAMVAAANMDPKANEDPEKLDLERHPNRHLAFGTGIHFCLGYQLARIEGKCALQALFRRWPKLALAVPADEIRWRKRPGLRAIETLPVVAGLTLLDQEGPEVVDVVSAGPVTSMCAFAHVVPLRNDNMVLGYSTKPKRGGRHVEHSALGLIVRLARPIGLALAGFALAAPVTLRAQEPELVRVATFNAYLLSPICKCANAQFADCLLQIKGETERRQKGWRTPSSGTPIVSTSSLSTRRGTTTPRKSSSTS